jgi:acetylornithine/N-succinyldiaminopimelate aminotransferase
VLDVMLAPGFLEHVRQMGNHLGQQLVGLVERHPEVFEEVRGTGLMRGLKCKLPQADVAAALRARGLLTVTAGENVIRLMPPLIIEAQQVSEAADAIEAAASELKRTLRKAG